MDQLLIKTLENAFGYPVMLQGSLSPGDEYPESFFTYWNDAADGESFYSNKENAILWQYSLNFYSADVVRVNSILLEAKKKLKAAGFVMHGAGHSVMSDEPTHTGRGTTVLYRQENK